MSITITARSAAVVALWLAGFTVAVFDIFQPAQYGALSIALTLVAATATVRGCIDKYAANWEAAYGAGREVSRVRQMR